MAKLIYSGLISLDGYLADAAGNFDWAAPDEEVHSFINDLERPVGTYLLGRRMYEVMTWWEDLDTSGEPAAVQDFADIWHAADKMVYSTALERPSTARTRLERTFDAGAVRELKASAERDISIGGAAIAEHALRAGLVDELSVFFVPVAVGGGTRFLPDGVGLQLELLDERRFSSGVVYLRYASIGPAEPGG
jgi:dihydrofolate reductase